MVKQRTHVCAKVRLDSSCAGKSRAGEEVTCDGVTADQGSILSSILYIYPKKNMDFILNI